MQQNSQVCSLCLCHKRQTMLMLPPGGSREMSKPEPKSFPSTPSHSAPNHTYSLRSLQPLPASSATPAVTHDPLISSTSSTHFSPGPAWPTGDHSPLISLPTSPPPIPQHTPTTGDALPPLDMIFSLRTPTLSHVPKAARALWATIVGAVLSSIVSNPSLERPWCCLFMLAKCILANPPRGGRSHWRGTLKLAQTRIK